MGSRFSSSSSESISSGLCANGVEIETSHSNEVSDKTTPVDSQYTKRKLMDLHPNIMVQRSPSHFQTGTFYWSHVGTVKKGLTDKVA